MDKELAVVLGMSISYAASLAGMFIAVWAYKRNTKRRRQIPPGGRSEATDGAETEISE
jgi:hypothetical protein